MRNAPPVPALIVNVTVKPVTPAPAPRPSTAPKWNNQTVVRSDSRNDGYRYSDWRNW